MLNRKSYKVYFARTSVTKEGKRLRPFLTKLEIDDELPHLRPVVLGGERFQVRDLVKVGTVWRGTFVKLRDEAPNIVNAADVERELDLDVGDHIIEKCHFMYRERDDVLVWQVNRAAGSMTRLQEYLGEILDTYVGLPLIQNSAELAEVLKRELYELEFVYDRPVGRGDGRPKYEQSEFDIMADIHAAHAKFLFRAEKGGRLERTSKRLVQALVGDDNAKKIRVRVTDESEPIELFMAPLRDSITVPLHGRYPAEGQVFAGLEEAFDRQRGNIPQRE